MTAFNPTRGDRRPDDAAGGGPYAHRLRVTQLNPRQANQFDLAPDADARARIAEALDLTDLPAARMTGRIEAAGADSWALTARLTARVVQPCVVTLAPVATALDEEVRRAWSPHATDPTGEEIEMPDDETEPLGQAIDLGAVLVEALSLALPLYPRAPDASLDDGAAPEPEAEDTRKPFAGLGDLLARRDTE
ncbi:YceD family protein [Paracoccus luteus]|uniref:YceD family protein n=1 Tax=Paracoccus luteus TaxID=2508543 RepID=UPI00107062D6|nr:DUF177 domain-containing protein [Paracoccus luteus]